MSDVQAPLVRLILSLADTKRLLGIRYSEWLLGAPSLEAGIAAASMAQDEWGHARLLYALLKELGEDPGQVEHERPAGAYASAPALDVPLSEWTDFVAAVVVVDDALALALTHLQQGGYEPATGRLTKMVAEEEFHRELGEAWLRKLAGGSPAAREAMQHSVVRMMESTLHALAPGDSHAQLLASQGVTPPPEVLARAIQDRWRGWVGLLGTEVPSWSWGDGEDPEGWEAARSRASGAPDEASVERARGDRNRALFVE